LKEKAMAKATIYIAPVTRRIMGNTEQGELSGRIAEIMDRYGEIIKRETQAVEKIITDIEDAPADMVGSEEERRTILAVLKKLTYAQSVAVVESARRILRREK
jgi:hypothetical protein